MLARFARVDILILDDWGLVGLKDAQRQDLLEILDDRDGNRSTIITSQLPIGRDPFQWTNWLCGVTRPSLELRRTDLAER